jgi:negative regulator of genetic competence, sporulation and motility
MTINIKMAEHQMNKIGFNKKDMAAYAKISYNSVHGQFSGKNKYENMSLKLYKAFEDLFSKTELMKASDFYVNTEEYDEWWFDMLEEALGAEDCKVTRSGAASVESNEHSAHLPAYTKVEWRYRKNSKSFYTLESPTMVLHIWDGEVYRSLNKKGQRDKIEIIKQWAKENK